MLAEQRQNYTASETEELRSQERKKALKLISKSKQQRAMKAVLLIGLGFIFVVCFLYVAVVTESYNIAYDINTVRGEIAAMEKEKGKMNLEVASLSSMERIEPLAMAMGMVYPEVSDKIFVAYAPAQVEQEAQIADAEADVKIEVLESAPDNELSFGAKVMQVLGSLFGGHFNIGTE